MVRALAPRSLPAVIICVGETMPLSIWIQSASNVLKSFGRCGKPRWARRPPRLEVLEDRRVPAVTAVNETFAATPNTATSLEVVGPALAAGSDPAMLLSTGAVSPGGATLTQNGDGSLTFTSPNAGPYTFNYALTGAQQEVTSSGAAFDQFGYSVAVDGN